jgi:cyclic pyranopterin phosphate synthase
MVDVTEKPVTDRTATAEGQVIMSGVAFEQVRTAAIAKGDVLAVAEVAGMMGAKRTADLIPLCHPLGLDHVRVEAMLDPSLPGVRIRATTRVAGRTGVEMEALTAVAVGCLTVYDMVKAADRGMTIGQIRLVAKSGGASGDWNREAGAVPADRRTAEP